MFRAEVSGQLQGSPDAASGQTPVVLCGSIKAINKDGRGSGSIWTESPCVNFRSYGNAHGRIGDDPFAISDRYLRQIRIRRT
jgi:hypothetical protein